MPEYTEQQIRELSGVELRVAVHRLVLGDDLTANTDDRIAEALRWFMPIASKNQFWSHRARYRLDFWSRRHERHMNLQTTAEMEQHVANWRAEPLEMPLDWCVPELMGPGKVLGWTREYWYDISNECGVWSIVRVDRGGCREQVTDYCDDPATAILRAACIVALSEGGD